MNSERQKLSRAAPMAPSGGFKGAEHSDRRVSHLHKLGIKVKIAWIKRGEGVGRDLQDVRSQSAIVSS
jgi:hypothetical protein